MFKLLATFQERFGDWVTALGQHLQLSLLTLLLAIFLDLARIAVQDVLKFFFGHRHDGVPPCLLNRCVAFFRRTHPVRIQ